MAQLKIPLDAHRFATGMTWKDYLAQMGDTRARTEENYHHASLTEDERRFFSGIRQARYALMLAENWCGDVHRNSPMLARIVEAMPHCERPHAATQRSFALRAKTTDIAPQDKQEAALQEFRSQMQAAYAASPEKSLWRDTAKEVRMILELRL